MDRYPLLQMVQSFLAALVDLHGKIDGPGCRLVLNNLGLSGVGQTCPLLYFTLRSCCAKIAEMPIIYY
jgi:hypothetical protein